MTASTCRTLGHGFVPSDGQMSRLSRLSKGAKTGGTNVAGCTTDGATDGLGTTRKCIWIANARRKSPRENVGTGALVRVLRIVRQVDPGECADHGDPAGWLSAARATGAV
jgi:hypothetical protein